MNDFITPSGLDLTNNLHGHVRVETRSRWTGKVIDSQEKDNLVTNALKTMVQTVQQYNALFSIWAPINEYGLGGLMLFNDTLTESASNIRFPSTAKLVAFAGQEADTTNAMCGSLNSSESILTSNGFTSVWDFLTSQGNGTIASLARTSFRVKNNPLFAYSGNAFTFANGSNSPYATAIGYDETNHILYFTVANNATVAGISFNRTTIYKTKYDITQLTLTSSPVDARRCEVVKTLTNSDGTQYAYNWVYDKFEDNFVYANGTTLHFIALDGTHTTKTATGVSGYRLAITENYFWVAGSAGGIYRITKTNTSDVLQISAANKAYIAPSAGDVVFNYAAGMGEHIIVYPDGSTVTVTGVTGNTSYPQYNSSYLDIFPLYGLSGTQNMIMFPSTNYLGTIANLDSPVTKTSSQTMKITYTLTES